MNGRLRTGLQDGETRVRGKITFSYVYDDPVPVELEFDLPDGEPDEQYLAFNFAEHGELGRR